MTTKREDRDRACRIGLLAAMRTEADQLNQRARKADTGGDVRAITTAWRAYEAAESMRVLAIELKRVWGDLERSEHERSE